MKQHIILALAMLATATSGLAATNFNLVTGKRLVNVNFWDSLTSFCETCLLQDDPEDCSVNNMGDACTCISNNTIRQARTLFNPEETPDPNQESDCQILRKP